MIFFSLGNKIKIIILIKSYIITNPNIKNKYASGLVESMLHFCSLFKIQNHKICKTSIILFDSVEHESNLCPKSALNWINRKKNAIS